MAELQPVESVEATASADPFTSTVLTATCSGELDDVTSGRTAEQLGELFISLRDAAASIAGHGDGGGVLLVVATDEPPGSQVVANAVRALVRGLAREYGSSAVRINAVVSAAPVTGALLDFLAGPAATVLTGAVFDLRQGS
jgi:hypothetical protein